MLDINAPVYPMENWTDEQWRAFHPICDGLEAHGYWVSSRPLEGQFDQWLEGKRSALRLVERQASEIRKVWGYRGRSRNLLDRLHTTLPEPVWGVEVHQSLPRKT